MPSTTLQPESRTSARRLTAGMLLLLSAGMSGCKARELGITFSGSQAKSTDASWMAAAKSCWPELKNGSSKAVIENYLTDPLHFRATFASYAALDDEALKSIVMKPIGEAPAPDPGILRNAKSPVLTRGQASSGAPPSPSPTNSGTLPDDALCAVHAGSPVGFR